AEAWHRRDGDGDGDSDGDGAGGASELRIERWHFEPDGGRPLAKELVPAGKNGAPDPVEAEWLPIVADQIGSPHALFGADGECRWRAEPQLWGRTRAARDVLRARAGQDEGDTDSASCALRFPGQWEDAESGLHYNLNRYYDPDTGQYLSPDPIGVDGGLRTHAYVHDPVGWMDPEGLTDAPGTVTYPLHPTITPQQGSYSSGIARAWAQEQALVRETGRGTVNWSPAQQAELLKTGKVGGYTGHHINNAATAPAWEGDPRNIRFLPNGRRGLPNDHLYSKQGHRGNWKNSTSGRLIDRMEMIKRFKAGCL
ncbi:MAG: RHS repeat-associated core domain-containing protein, partial [Pseudomonadota bacterium]